MTEYLLRNKGLFVFSDPGGAKALLALIFQLKEKGFPRYKVISDRQYSFYPEFKVEIEIITHKELKKTLNYFNPDYIFTGTSYTSQLELKCISFANQQKIPSYSFIDHWTSFKKRFKLNDNYIFPDKVLVIDERAFELAKQEGIPSKLLKVFPNPYLKYLQNWKPSISRENFLRRNKITNFSTKIISYLPEPLSNAGGVSKFGLDEYYCLKLLQQAVIPLKNRDYMVLIKPHPNQDKKKLEKKVLFLSENSKIEFKIIEEDINTLIYYSNIVIGIFSNALIEASFFQKPIFRILKGLKVKDPLESMNIGICIYSEEELSNILIN